MCALKWFQILFNHYCETIVSHKIFIGFLTSSLGRICCLLCLKLLTITNSPMCGMDTSKFHGLWGVVEFRVPMCGNWHRIVVPHVLLFELPGTVIGFRGYLCTMIWQSRPNKCFIHLAWDEKMHIWPSSFAMALFKSTKSLVETRSFWQKLKFMTAGLILIKSFLNAILTLLWFTAMSRAVN